MSLARPSGKIPWPAGFGASLKSRYSEPDEYILVDVVVDFVQATAIRSIEDEAFFHNLDHTECPCFFKNALPTLLPDS